MKEIKIVYQNGETRKGKNYSRSLPIISKKGYQSMSLKEIIAKSQLSKGTIYHRFDSKYAIYLAALEAYYFNLFQHR